MWHYLYSVFTYIYFLLNDNDLQESRKVIIKFPYEYIRKTWKGKMIKIMLKGRKQSDTYLAIIRRHRWSAQMTMKKNIKWSFQPAQWLSSALICALQRCLRIIARQVLLYFLNFNIIFIIKFLCALLVYLCFHPETSSFFWCFPFLYLYLQEITN